MAHDIYSLDGQVPQNIVKGESPDISAFALFCWYEWVMFRVSLYVNWFCPICGTVHLKYLVGTFSPHDFWFTVGLFCSSGSS
jgi:hypothetical protein